MKTEYALSLINHYYGLISVVSSVINYLLLLTCIVNSNSFTRITQQRFKTKITRRSTHFSGNSEEITKLTVTLHFQNFVSFDPQIMSHLEQQSIAWLFQWMTSHQTFAPNAITTQSNKMDSIILLTAWQHDGD